MGRPHALLPTLLLIPTLALALALACLAHPTTPTPPPPPPPAPICDVRDYGARGDGVTLDTAAIQRAVNNRSCATVRFAGGTFLAATVTLRSHLTLEIAASAEVLATNASVYLPPEPNPYAKYQDPGHSFFHPALFLGEDLTQLRVVGGGSINGAGLLSSHPPSGRGDKTLSLRNCSDIELTGVTWEQTGHFALLATNCSNLYIHDTTFLPQRDGLDIVGCLNVLIERIRVVGGGDDALVFKSDFSTGQVLATRNVTVRHSVLGTRGATALEIGSETVGPFTDMLFEDLVIVAAGDAAMGIANMDGAHISNVVYRRIQAADVASAIELYLGARLSQPHPAGPGSISNIVFEDIRVTHQLDVYRNRNWTSMVDGQPPLGSALLGNGNASTAAAYPIGPNITLTNVFLEYKGGGLAADLAANPYHNATSRWFCPNDVRPAYGLFVRQAAGLTLTNLTLAFEVPDDRPAVVVGDGGEIALVRSRAQRAASLTFDVGIRPGGAATITDSPGLVSKKL